MKPLDDSVSRVSSHKTGAAPGGVSDFNAPVELNPEQRTALRLAFGAVAFGIGTFVFIYLTEREAWQLDRGLTSAPVTVPLRLPSPPM